MSADGPWRDWSTDASNETTNKRTEANRVKCGIKSGSILEAEFRDSSVFQKVFDEHRVDGAVHVLVQ
jgi:hypothetical protein